MSDPDDDWGRFTKKLRETRAEQVAQITSGGCDQNQYHGICGYIRAIDEAIELSRAIRRGDDLKPPERREPLRSPED